MTNPSRNKLRDIEGRTAALAIEARALASVLAGPEGEDARVLAKTLECASLLAGVMLRENKPGEAEL